METHGLCGVVMWWSGRIAEKTDSEDNDGNKNASKNLGWSATLSGSIQGLNLNSSGFLVQRRIRDHGFVVKLAVLVLALEVRRRLLFHRRSASEGLVNCGCGAFTITNGGGNGRYPFSKGIMILQQRGAYISSITMCVVVTFIWETPAGERRNIGALIGRDPRPSSPPRFLEFPVPSSPMHTSRLRKSCRRMTSRHAAIDLQYNAIRMTRESKK